MMPSARPFVNEEEAAAVAEVLSSGWLGCGPKTKQFEEALASFLGCPYVVAVNSGTAALQLSLESQGIGFQDEVIVPSFTFCASVQAINSTGAAPVFVDIDPETLCIDTGSIKNFITRRTKAIMPVHYGGHACDMNALLAIAELYDIVIVEDAAHAFGSTYQSRRLGSFGHFTCFSFDPIKNITCGEGGAVALHDATLAQKIRELRMLGMALDGYTRHKRGGSCTVTGPGYRYHMSDINAAIGLQQLGKFTAIIERRRSIWNQYTEAFAQNDVISLLNHNLMETVPFHFVVRVHLDLRDDLLGYLRSQGIGAGIHYYPNHLQPFFKKQSVRLPVTERIVTEILTLPLYPSMTDADVEWVVTKVNEGIEGLLSVRNQYGHSH